MRLLRIQPNLLLDFFKKKRQLTYLAHFKKFTVLFLFYIHFPFCLKTKNISSYMNKIFAFSQIYRKVKESAKKKTNKKN